MEKKKIIIFGATGNVGSYLTLYALNFFDKEKFEVIASGRRKTDFWTKQGVPYYSVIHLAAQIPSYMHDYNPRKYIDSIVVGTTNVLEYCRKVKADRIMFSQTVFDVSLFL